MKTTMALLLCILALVGFRLCYVEYKLQQHVYQRNATNQWAMPERVYDPVDNVYRPYHPFHGTYLKTFIPEYN